MLRIQFRGSIAISLAAFAHVALTEDLPQLLVRPTGGGVELTWKATEQTPDGMVVRPNFELQRSEDFTNWEPFSERQRAGAASSPQSLSVTIQIGDSPAFFRLLKAEKPAVAKLGNGGAEVLGYVDAFGEELQRIGRISPEQFASMFPNETNYLPG